MYVTSNERPQNCNFRSAKYIECCWNCDFSEENPSYSGGNMDCNKHKAITDLHGICDNFYDSSSLNNKGRTKEMTREEIIDKSRHELRAMQLEALIHVTKEFLETCDDMLEREVLDELELYNSELDELKKAYELDF